MPALVLPTSLISASVRCRARGDDVGGDPPHGGADQHEVGSCHAGGQIERCLLNCAQLAGQGQRFRLPANADDRLGQSAPRDPQSDRAPDQTDADDGHTTKHAHEWGAISLWQEKRDGGTPGPSQRRAAAAGGERHGAWRQRFWPAATPRALERGIVANRAGRCIGVRATVFLRRPIRVS